MITSARRHRHRARVSGFVLLVAAAVPACSDAEPTGSRDDAGAATGAASPSAAPSTRVVLPFDGGYEWRMSVAPDGQTALVAHSEGFFPQSRQSTIYEVTRQADGSWADAVEVSFVGDDSSDIDPVFTADGSRVWFSSIRPVDGAARTDVDVWYVDRTPDGTWGEPVNAAGVNSARDDLYPSVGPDGSVYVGSDRGEEGFDIWRSPAAGTAAWGPAQVLPAPVTTSGWEFNPALSPDGSALVFTARSRGGGEGEGDLFLSRLAGGQWSDPVPLEEVNTARDEYHPSFSPDGDTLYFVRSGDLHQLPVAQALPAG